MRYSNQANVQMKHSKLISPQIIAFTPSTVFTVHFNMRFRGHR